MMPRRIIIVNRQSEIRQNINELKCLWLIFGSQNPKPIHKLINAINKTTYKKPKYTTQKAFEN